MEFGVLNKAEVKTIYQNNLVKDFPADETKPLDTILEAMDNKNYQCFAIRDGGKLMCYAFVAFGEDTSAALLDYLAVKDTLRGKGFGSRMLTELVKYFGFMKTKRHLIVEVESVESTTDLKTIRTRQNRIHFYLKNGMYLDSHNRPKISGVEYRLLYMKFPQYTVSVEEGDCDRLVLVPETTSITTEQEQKIFVREYDMIYHTMLSKELYDEMVDLSNCTHVS